SRGITISNVVAIGCTTGFYVVNFNQPMSGDDKWWRFGIQISDLIARDCEDDSLLIRNAAGVIVRGVKARNKRIRILHARDCALSDIDLKNGKFLVEGQSDGLTTETSPNLNLTIRNVATDNGYVDIHNCRGLDCIGVRVTHPVGEGLRVNGIVSSRLDGIAVE
ncbi:MAG: hypothetical protein ACXWKG_15395, partial [Limisphaerales bacterium]